MPTSSNTDRLEVIVNMLIEFSRGNFDIQEPLTDDDDPLNTVLAGLNMVGEELAHYKKELDNQNTFLHNLLSSIDEVIYAREVTFDNLYKSPFIFLSSQCMQILGISNQDLIANPQLWIESVHPDDLEEIRKTSKKMWDGAPSVYNYRFFNPVKNEYVWIEDRIVPKKNEQGVVTNLFGSARDITNQKTTLLELEDKNRLISRIISASDQLFYIVSIHQGNTFANDFSYISWQVENILGITVDEIKKRPLGWLKSIHPDDLPKLKKYNELMFAIKEPVMRVYRCRHAQTGEYIWLEDYVVPVTDKTGKVKELYGSARDISARKNAEEGREKLIKELSNKFNELMQFNYIVSHNLRAPVAHIKGLSALLGNDLSEKDRKETVAYIQEAADSMDVLLQDLNVILSTRSMLNEKVEPFLLSHVIKVVQNNLFNEIKKSGAIINSHIEPDADELTSIKSYIQSTMFNLVSNAIKYRDDKRTPTINIHIRRISDDKTEITVSDNGLGIDLNHAGHKIFGLHNRFHHGHEGKGLGLYMTKTQIESLGGSITVNSTVGTGTTFTVIV